MAVATFDTLKYLNTLKAAGVPDKQADAQALALYELMQLNLKELATKDDLTNLKNELKHEMKESETRLVSKLDLMQQSHKSEMAIMKYMLGIIITLGVGIAVRLFVYRGGF